MKVSSPIGFQSGLMDTEAKRDRFLEIYFIEDFISNTLKWHKPLHLALLTSESVQYERLSHDICESHSSDENQTGGKKPHTSISFNQLQIGFFLIQRFIGKINFRYKIGEGISLYLSELLVV